MSDSEQLLPSGLGELVQHHHPREEGGGTRHVISVNNCQLPLVFTTVLEHLPSHVLGYLPLLERILLPGQGQGPLLGVDGRRKVFLELGALKTTLVKSQLSPYNR